MQRKPNATRPKAKIEAGTMWEGVSPMTFWSSPWLTKKAPAIRPAMSRPFQKALKLPATNPERMVSDAPPSRDAVTISCTCLEWELVKILVNSGISTAARVPQLMMTASCHQRFGRNSVTSLPSTNRTMEKSPMSSLLMRNDVEMHRIDAIQIKRVNGSSKLNSVLPLYCASDHAWLMK